MNSLFLVAFPKAGWILGGIPFYVSLFWGMGLSFTGAMRCLAQPRNLGHALLLATGVWITLLFVFNLTVTSFSDPVARARTLFLWASMMTIFMWACKPLTESGVLLAEKGIRNAYLFVVAYGYLQLLLGPETVNINHLTSTGSGGIEDILAKNNVLHEIGVDKVFSTYQNGNLLGVALIMMLPIALRQIHSGALRFALFAATSGIVVTTGSAAAMMGMAALIGFTSLDWLRHGKVNVTYMIIGIVIIPAAIFFFLSLEPIQAILQARLMGRDISGNIRWLKVAMWVGDVSSSISAALFGRLQPEAAVFEVTPIAIAQYFGLPAAAMYYGTLLVVARMTHWSSHKLPIIIYLAASVGDGGYWLTPSPFLFGLVVHLSVSRDALALKRHATIVRSQGEQLQTV
ncbi:hypothetical protein [Sinirhodobacter huangdaonensis]|uniref:Uncharacterized protein n=1 Tax=Paenirhodobacter huangdaonensis TaxID=2501515 RepID=A0A443LEY0_9RHOB|nr:hypothetical protein [Sinirhodobacter huangdaonensis]RWR47713.1 hypothetical protein EOW66_19160 [Sinirhodobacter huangdaonensis]